MAEEINYASVVFKSNKASSPPANLSEKKEETVYDEVKTRNEAGEKTADANDSAGPLADQKENDKRRHCQLLACCLGVLCVILVFVIVGVSVYLSLFRESEQDQLTSLLADNQNLTNLNKNLRTERENLMRNNSNLTVQLQNLTQGYDVLENNNTRMSEEIQNLTTQNQNLKTRIQELEKKNQDVETQRNNLTQEINNMKTEWSQLNASRAHWSIDTYCSIDIERECTPCQEGWTQDQSSCFAFNNAASLNRKTWEEARENCTGRGSYLAVIVNEGEKSSLAKAGHWTIGGFWIGLRAEGGKWKWLDGSDLTETNWMPQPAADGHCGVFVNGHGLQSVKCSEKQQWVCQMKVLYV